MARHAPHGGEGPPCGDTTLRLLRCRRKGKEPPEAAIQHLTCANILRTDLNNTGGSELKFTNKSMECQLVGRKKIQGNKKVSAGKQSSPAPKSIYKTMKHEGRG